MLAPSIPHTTSAVTAHFLVTRATTSNPNIGKIVYFHNPHRHSRPFGTVGAVLSFNIVASTSFPCNTYKSTLPWVISRLPWDPEHYNIAYWFCKDGMFRPMHLGSLLPSSSSRADLNDSTVSSTSRRPTLLLGTWIPYHTWLLFA